MNNVVLIFDWDDTLIDIGQALMESQYDACSNMLTKYPFTQNWQAPKMQDLQKHIGQRFKEVIIPSIFPEFNAEKHQAWQQELTELFWHNYSLKEKKLFPKVPETLNELKKDFTLAIATNKSRHLLQDDFKAVGLNRNIFAQVVCGDDPEVEKRFKPQPDMINIIQRHFDASHFVMIGDRKFDMLAAQNSNKRNITKTIAIANKNNDFNADLTLQKAADITAKTIWDLINN